MTIQRLKGIIKKLFRLIGFNLFKELFQHPFVINASVSIGYDGKLIKSNWGDDINLLFFKEVVDAPIIMYSESVINRLFRRKNFVPIGSIIGMCTNEQSVIWGSGILKENTKPIKKPLAILAVRGPRTRRKLQEWGIECPEIYGDPAMLISRYYKPNCKKKYKIGLIPHHEKTKAERVREIFEKEKDVHIIDIRNYESWTSFIDEIVSCEMIASYSLHGLIMAEAYGIPSVWIRFSSHIESDTFKYYDFYESIGKFHEQPLLIDNNTTTAAIIAKAQEWTPGYIDLEPLLEACPFPLNRE